MYEEEQDVISESSPEEDVNLEESSDSIEGEEQEQESEEPTSLNDGTPEDKAVPYDRFKDVVEERNYLRQIAQQKQEQSLIYPKEEVDPYAQYSDPATKLYMQERDKAMYNIAKKVAAEEKAPLIRQNEILRQQIATIQHDKFRETNSDVVPGSPEEQEIARYVSMGMPLEQASWAVMGKNRVERAKSGVQKVKQEKTKMKAKANLATTSSVPVNNGLPEQRKSFIERMEDNMADWNGMIQ